MLRASIRLAIAPLALLGGLIAAQEARGEQFLGINDEQLGVLQSQLAASYSGGNLLNDPIVDEYLRELAQSLSPSVRIHLVTASSEVPNAFANWGNVIIINAGLVPFAGSEQGLLGVIAHEIAHVELGHFTRLDENMEIISALATGTLLIGLLSSSSNAPELITGAAGISKSQEYYLRRRYEREADRKAVEHLAEAEVDPQAYLDLITRLSAGSNVPEYASTHPFGAERAAIIETMRRSLNLPEGGDDVGELPFWLVRERILDVLPQTYADGPPAPLRPLVAAYARMIGGERLAEGDLEQLSSYGSHWIIAQALAQREAADGGPEAAASTLERAIEIWPGKLSLREMHLRMLAAAGLTQEFRYQLNSMPAELRASSAISDLEAIMWEEAGEEFRYRVAAAHSKYYDGMLGDARRQIAEASKLPEARENSSAAGRLLELERKIRDLQRQLN